MKNSILEPFIKSVENVTMCGIIVIKDGEKIAEYDWEPKMRMNQYSASKSFTSAAVGMAITEGLLNLDDKVIDYFPESIPEKVSPELESLTVKHLLTMSVGHDEAYLMGTQRPLMKEKDWVKFSLGIPFKYKPGTKFLYSNVGPYLAGMIVQRKAGCNLVDYLMPRLFEPLETLRPTWECDPMGNTFGAGGLFLTVNDLAKFSQLYLQKGIWNGKQIIPKEWVEATAKPQISTDRDDVYSNAYSYLFWHGPNKSYRADGKYGQFGIILPEKNTVIAINAYNRDQGNILDLLWKNLYPMI